MPDATGYQNPVQILQDFKNLAQGSYRISNLNGQTHHILVILLTCTYLDVILVLRPVSNLLLRHIIDALM